MDGEISAAELEGLMESDSEDVLVVDIRSPTAFERRHIEPSRNIPLPRLPGEIEEVAGADYVVTVCPHGESSRNAASLISAFEGFSGRAYSLECGLNGWDGPTAGSASRPGNSPSEPPF